MDNLFMIENSVSVEGGVPKQFKILPLGLVHSQKGDFLVDNESYSSIREDFKERGLQIPVDYEHQTLHDVQAPAAGWIQDIVLKSDGIYALTDWTERGSEYLRNREYKYCSPVIMARTADRKAVKLHSVALTNKPAIDAMTPIVNKDKPTPPPEADVEPSEVSPTSEGGATIKDIAKLLQLPLPPSMDEIYQAVAKLLNSQAALKLKVDAMQFDAYKVKAEGAVELALKEGKIAPYQRDWAFRSAMSDVGEFIAWFKAAPQAVPLGEIAYEPLTLKEASTRSRAHELMGLSADDVKRYGGKL